MEINEIDISKIILSELNTRKDLESGTEDVGLDELANSIQEKGLLTPIIVKSNSDGTYGLIAGQRRYLACKKLGWKKIPSIIREISDDTDATIISLIENVHRADMSPMDKARAYQKVYEKYQDYNRTAKETGVSISTIKKYISLLNLAPSIQAKISTAEGPFGIGTLSKIAQEFKPEDQVKVLEEIGGFTQQIQLEILKRAKGDLSRIGELKENALLGAFDVHSCRGIYECIFIPDELKDPVKEAIQYFKDTESLEDAVRKLKNRYR
ncbi:MAG: ParB/RepB/Spo0J family partition protein [Candidatus Methanosuratincola sp.]